MHRHGAAAVGHHGIGPRQLIEIGFAAPQHGVEVGIQGGRDPQTAGQLHHLAQTSPLRQPQGHHVFGTRQPLGHAGAAATAAAARHVTERCTGNGLGGGDPRRQGRQVGEQLEGGARLAQGLHAIEAGAAVIAAAHVGQDRAGFGVHRDQGPLGEARGGGRPLQEALELLLGQLLQRRLDGADHGVVAAGIGAAEVEAEAGALQLSDHVVAEERVTAVARLAAGRRVNVEGAPLGIDQGLIAEPALLMHQFQHQVAPLQAGAGVVRIAGAVAIGTGQQTHQKRRLPHIQIRGRLAEVQLGRLLEAFGAQAQVGPIEIELEDLVLAEAHLQLQGHPQLPQLAGEAQVAAHIGVHHAGHLLGEAAAAAGAQQGGAQGAEQIDAAVPPEARLLGGHQRLTQVQGIGPQTGQGRGGTLLGIDLLAAGGKNLDRPGDRANAGAAADAGRQQHAAHQQG